MLTIDLHCHSDRSDGALAPQDLIARGAMRGLRVIALTDHDTIAGLPEAAATAAQRGIELIGGVEISVTWGAVTLHVLGLRIDSSEPRLLEGLATVRAVRMQRAEQIALRLQREGVGGALDAALAAAANGETVGRMHFARHLVALGHVKDVRAAFRRFLGDGKPAFVRARWASLGDAIDWIRGAGGIAVLAHPGRYRLRPARLRALCQEFKSLGGGALEVLSASHTTDDVARLTLFAQELDLRVSAGSDFHSPEASWLDLGELPRSRSVAFRSGAIGPSVRPPLSIDPRQARSVAQYLTVHPQNPQPRLIRRAADVVHSGGVIVYPTDSCYALGCRVGDKDAAQRIRTLRALPEGHHLTLVCASLAQVAQYARLDDFRFRTVKRITPGSYVFILPATKEVPRRLQHPRRKTIGVRVPDHEVVMALLSELREPLLSSTLLLEGEEYSLNDVDAIRERLDLRVDLVLDAGPCGLEPSTVVDLTGDVPVVVRKGKGPTAGYGWVGGD